MKCKDVERRLFDYLDETTSPGEREAMESHLSMCATCRRKVEAFALTQQELRQGLTGSVAGASPSPHNWAMIEARLAAQEQKGLSLWERAKARAGEGFTQLGYRPLYQKAIAGLMVVAAVVALCVMVHLPQGQPIEALAKEIATEDPGFRVMMIEEGFPNLSSLEAVVVKAGEADTRHVHFVDPETHTPVAVVTVNTKDRSVLSISFSETTESFSPVPITDGKDGLEPLDQEHLLELARKDPEVAGLLDAGAEVIRWSRYTSSQGEEVMVELRLEERKWLLSLALPEGVVKGLYEDQTGSISIVTD